MAITFDEFLIALTAKPTGTSQEWSASCPVPGHGKGRGDRGKSFSIGLRGGRALVRCHGNCGQDRVIEALEERELWPVQTDADAAREVEIKRISGILDLPPPLLKYDSHLIDAKLLDPDHYMRARGLDLAVLRDILFHPSAYHSPSGTEKRCMVAAVRNPDGELRGLFRTFLTGDDPPRKIKPCMFYPGGEYAGNAIHLSPASEEMLVGEGIESVASAMRLLQLPGWAATGADFLAIVQLPELVRSVVIAADNDDPGMDAAMAAARRFRREGRKSRIVKPGICDDFNTLLLLRQGPLPPIATQAAGGQRQ